MKKAFNLLLISLLILTLVGCSKNNETITPTDTPEDTKQETYQRHILENEYLKVEVSELGRSFYLIILIQFMLFFNDLDKTTVLSKSMINSQV